VIYLSQNVRFAGPVDVGDRVTAVCEVVEALGDGRFRLQTTVEDDEGEPVIEGEAVVLLAAGPEADAEETG
jgi:acyl dehydratase